MNFQQKEAWIWPLFLFLAAIDIWLRWFDLEREEWTCNPGVMWGITLSPILLFLGTVGFLLLVGYLLWKAEHFKSQSFLSLMLLGGCINALDRFSYGCVLDYFSWPLGLASFLPNFNLADSCILLGALGMLVDWLFLLRKHKESN